MLKNYFKIAIRNISRNKVFSFINVMGLSIGIACTILIMLWVLDELSYDKFHENSKNIYRVLVEYKDNADKRQIGTTTPALLSDVIAEEVPEILYAAKWSADQRDPLMYEEKRFYEDGISSVDPDFLKMFSFQFIYGNAETAFPNAQSVVITERIAKKYFGDEYPIGKILNWNNWQHYVICGVIKDVPTNSHIKFDFLRTFENERGAWPGGFTWNNWNRHLYVQLIENTDINFVTTKINDLIRKNNPDLTNRPDIKLFLQNIEEIHLNSDSGDEYAEVRDIKYIYIYSLIAVFMLFIACINFINLSTARSLKRAREVGLRKTIGANRNQIVFQFLGESFLLSTIATVNAIILVELVLPLFNSITTKTLYLDFFSYKFMLGSIAVILITGLLAGSYPAMFLSSFKPIKVLKEHHNTSRSNVLIRKGLVVFQFSISIILIFITLVVYKQINFISNKNLGFEKENVLLIPIKDKMQDRYESFKNRLVADTKIHNVSVKAIIPTTTRMRVPVSFESLVQEKPLVVDCAHVGYDYFDTMSMDVIEGRAFSKEFPADVQNKVLLNEEAVKRLGIKESVIGRPIKLGNRVLTIIGVVNNAYTKSLHYEIAPQIYVMLNNLKSNEINLSGVILIKISGKDVREVIKLINNEWDIINPTYPLEISFLDDTYNKLYHAEFQIQQLFGYFTLLAIIISILGLFGLSSYSTEQRTKEIGIRKVLGASVNNLVQMLSREFIILVMISLIIALPIAYYAINKWLESFANRTEVGILTFVISGIIALLISLATVGYQAVKAAMANPVNSLRYE